VFLVFFFSFLAFFFFSSMGLFVFFLVCCEVFFFFFFCLVFYSPETATPFNLQASNTYYFFSSPFVEFIRLVESVF